MNVCITCASTIPSGTWECSACGHTPTTTNGIPLLAPALATSDEFFDRESFEIMAELEPKSFWFRARQRNIEWAIRRYFPQARSFLEVGCGTGFVLSNLVERFPHMRCAGGEIYLEGLEFARERVPAAQFHQLDARHLPFSKEFDLIGAFDMLEHVEEDRQALTSMYEAITPGGGLLLAVPQHPWLWSDLDEYNHHKRRYTRRELVGKVQDAGFQVLRATSFVSLILPVMYAARLFQRNTGATELAAEHRRGSMAAPVLSPVLRFESMLIRAGASFPAGGSLLLAARKPASGPGR